MAIDIIQEAVRGTLKLPAVPRVVTRLIVMLRDPAASTNAIADEVEQDPAIAARTLQLANSPFYSGRRSLASISDAVAVLGSDGLLRLVLTTGLASVFVQVPGVNLRQFWHDAMVAASVARSLARLSPTLREHGEAAYVAGLLHAAGHLILCTAHPAAAAAAFDAHLPLRGSALAQLEQDNFGTSHPAVGAAWVRHLGFPPLVGDAIATYLQPAAGPAGALAPVVHLAAGITASLGEGDSAAEALARIDPAHVAAIAVDQSDFAADLHANYERLGSLWPQL